MILRPTSDLVRDFFLDVIQYVVHIFYQGSVRVKLDVADSFVWRISFTCKSHSQLRRTEIFRKSKCADGAVGNIISPMVVSYTYDGTIPESIIIESHGNSKSNLPFHPSSRKLLTRLHDAVIDKPSIPPSRLYNQVKPINQVCSLLSNYCVHYKSPVICWNFLPFGLKYG